jgi:hypothetical protein
MKKTIIILSVLLVIISSNVFGQLVHVEGAKTIDLTLGKSKQGFQAMAGYNVFFKRNIFLQSNIGFETGQLDATNKSGNKINRVSDFSSYEINTKLHYTIWKWQKLYLNTNGGLVLGYEVENSQISEKYNADWSFGFVLGGLVEYWNLGNWGFGLGFDQYLMVKSIWGNKYLVNLQVKYNL